MVSATPGLRAALKNTSRKIMLILFQRLSAPLGRFGMPFWTLLNVEGPIRMAFLEVFGAVAITRKKHRVITIVLLKMQCANIAHDMKDTNIHSEFLDV